MAKTEQLTTEPIKFRARAAFVRLDKPKQFNGQGDPRWECTFLIDPASKDGQEDIKKLLKAAAELSKQAYGGIVPLELKRLAARFVTGAKAPAPTEKEDGIEMAFFDGSKKEYDGFDGMFVIPAHNSKMKPGVANRRGVTVAPGDDQYPYSGCYVVGSITLWAQNNSYGKRIGVNLRGVQFVRDGEAFGVADVKAEEEFTGLEDEGDTATADDDVAF